MKVICHPDPREETITRDKYALGTFVCSGGSEKLVVHVPNGDFTAFM